MPAIVDALFKANRKVEKLTAQNKELKAKLKLVDAEANILARALQECYEFDATYRICKSALAEIDELKNKKRNG